MSIAYISDSRFLVSEDGGIWTTTSHFGGSGWKRGLEQVPELVLAGRATVVTTEHVAKTAALKVDCESFSALPDFRGVRGLLVNMPSLVSAVRRTVRENERILCRLPSVSGLIAIAIARFDGRWIGCEVVGDIRDVELGREASRAGNAVSRVAGFVTRLAVRQADAVRYMTRSTLQRSYPARKGAEIVGFSSVTLDPFWFEKCWRPRSGEGPVLLNIGTMEQSYKGQDLLISLVRKLRARDVDVRLVLIGDGKKREDLERRARNLGVADYVQFLGYIRDRRIVREHMLNADVFLLPSRTEGLPRALLEAMAVGVPCISSRAGGCIELLPEAYTVEIDDEDGLYRKTRQLVGTADLDSLLSISNSNRDVAEGYSVDQLASLKRKWRSIVVGSP